MKEWLRKLLKQKEEKRSALKQKGDKSEDVQEVRSIISDIEDIDKEIAELRQQIDTLPDDPVAGGNTPPEQRGAHTPAGNPALSQVLAAFGLSAPQQRSEEPTDPYGTLEYRNAFMTFAKRGRSSRSCGPML